MRCEKRVVKASMFRKSISRPGKSINTEETSFLIVESKLTNKVKIFGEMIVERRGLSPGRGQGRRKQKAAEDYGN